tara:strand:- start:479 stop:1981 length:1503 start_codon:yes stop_codon:yes gene_type:complete
MGIFTDLALGGITQFGEVAERDTQANVTIASNSLAKENEALKKTELAQKNFQEIKNIVKSNPSYFNIVPTGNFTLDQMVDMYVLKPYKEQRSIFEDSSFDKVKMNFANYAARDVGEPIIINDPYTPSADLFQTTKDKHAEKITAISKTPRVDKLFLNLDKIDEKFANVKSENEQILDAQIKIASITAKGYGLFGKFPGDNTGNEYMNTMKVNIIVANSKATHPNDLNKRVQFINQKLYENNIDPEKAVAGLDTTYGSMAKIILKAGDNIAQQIANNTGNIAAADSTTAAAIHKQNEKMLLAQLQMVNDNIQRGIAIKAGPDKKQVMEMGAAKSTQIDMSYKPELSPDGKINLSTTTDGMADQIDLLDVINDKSKLARLPKETQNYINAIKQKFFDSDGNMIKPERNMFIDGPDGDLRFKNFSTFYSRITPIDTEELVDISGYGFIETPPRKEKKPKAVEKKLKENQFRYNGKVYNIPERFKNQSLTETLKKAIASEQDKK